MDAPLAGYRLVRLLARGAHAEVWLGVTDEATAPVAIKLFHPATPHDRIDSELETLARLSHRHVQRLLDVSVDAHGRTCLVLERLGPSVARLLAERTELSLGEAVTILAPASEALHELHRVGVAHGRLDAGSLLIDSVGAPVLACFGSAQVVGDLPLPPQPASLTPAEETASALLTADREAIARLAAQVLSHTNGDRTLLDWVHQQTAHPREFALELAERLYALAPGQPLAMPQRHEPRETDAAALRSSLQNVGYTRPGDDAAEDAPAAVERPRSWWSDGAAAALVPEWLDAWIERMRADWLPSGVGPRGASIMQMIADRVRAALAAVRPRVWLLAAAGLAALILTVVVTATSTPSTAGSLDDDSGPHAAAPAPSTSPTAQASAIADTPLEASRDLLRLRDTCFAKLSVLCLDDVDQAGSAAMDADRHAIRQRQQGADSTTDIDWGDAELALIDELGDGALIDAIATDGRTATLLLVRTSDGWRIRDLIE